jgi:hypothetical protein
MGIALITTLGGTAGVVAPVMVGSSRPMRRRVVALAVVARLAAMATAMTPHNTLLTRCIQKPPWEKTKLPQKTREPTRLQRAIRASGHFSTAVSEITGSIS